MTILHADTNHPVMLQKLAEAGFDNMEAYDLSQEEILQKQHLFEGIIIRSRFKIDKEFINAAPNLKFIARVGAGLDSIDVDYAESRCIELFSAPEGNSNAVGEHALGMLLSLFNKLNNADREVRDGLWHREENRGWELEGKTVGLIGYGNMGKSFARKLKGFDVDVLFYDIKEGVANQDARQVSYDELFEKADVLSLHTPFTPSTNQMINRDFISRFEKPFWFINTARGKSVVTKDLVEALKSGKILGAGLDVLEYEKSSFESLFSKTSGDQESESIPEALRELMQLPQTVLSPHIAGWTRESHEKLATVIANKIIAKFSGRHQDV